MPVYEYTCEKCQHRFEKLVRGAAQVACPGCESPDVRKLFSTFSSPGPSSAMESFCPPGGCGSCPAPGQCMMN